MPGIDDGQWSQIVEAVKSSECTPFIGAGASADAFPDSKTLSERWAKRYQYPLHDSSDLQRVSQYLAIKEHPLFPKKLIKAEFTAPDDFSKTPYRQLAKLPFKVYVTTNYDDLIERSLGPEKDPEYDICRWNRFDAVFGTPGYGTDYEPSIARPLVYHLHGRYDIPQSLVLTEEDYLDFLVALSGSADRRTDVLDSRVIKALAGNMLIFLGYSLSDLTFRVVIRGLMGSITASISGLSVAIQLDPHDIEVNRLTEARDYLQEYFATVSRIKIGMFWGEARTFVDELVERFQA